MALNFPSCSFFSTPFIHADDDSSRSIYSRSPLASWETENGYGYIGEHSGSVDVDGGTFDPVDLLPDDPFGMGIDSSMGAAIASFLEVSGGDLFGWTLLYSPESQFYHDGWTEEHDAWMEDRFTGLSVDEVQDENLKSSFDMGESSMYNYEGEDELSGDEGLPHEGLLLSLGYLGLRDLLSIEGVCRSLRSTVQSDSLLWRCIHLDYVLGEKITDDALLQLAQRAHGNLHCLSLSGCSKITDDGLKQVMDISPKLKKLNVSGCVRLSLDGIINNLKLFQSQGMQRIEHLRLGRLFVVSEEQYGELKSLLGIQQDQSHNPRFYHTCRISLACADDCVLDIEKCPVCQKYKLVYDCPSESCQSNGSHQCRACDACIPRCVHCGKCIRDCMYVETFCLEYLCSGCWRQPPENESNLENCSLEI
ncbi:hypothetical protein Cni_G06128 [Canna indica]|uniref:F-box domain-containing protein n=1 Tax=Canna indica TaxID=4628 RepID=A0AAQ3Q5N5_9LILI|nr:hypothetical protein Cni_G06128 [Canna indica]